MKNGSETDIDCGGCSTKCATAASCNEAADCQSVVCTGGVCQAPTCTDAVKNGSETDIDCGGSCPKCEDGQVCGRAADCQSGVCQGGICLNPTSCKAIKATLPGSADGIYTIDPDGPGGISPLQVRCDMTTDGGGYTMVRFDDAALGGNQDAYAAKCAAVGMEIIVPRTKAHAQSIYAWNGNVVPNLYNIFPQFDGAPGIFNWQGICKGQPCSFWMTDNSNADVSCGGYEPNGDNSTAYRIYKWNDGCGLQGGWNDAYGNVQYTGHVICSTNDK